MSDYRVYDMRGARARSRSVTPRREHGRPSREAVMERGRRLKRASHRVALSCFAAFAVLAGLRAGPTASSPSATHQRRHHRPRHHGHARHTSTTRARATSSTSTATPAPSSSGSNLAPQQTSQPPVVQSSGS